MVSDIIQKQVEDIQGEWAKRLQELSIIVLLLIIILFVESWFGDYIIIRILNYSPSLQMLYVDVYLLIAVIVFLYTMLYFWRLRNTPQFHVLFIERKEEQKQIDTNSFFRLFLIPISVSIGLAFTTLSYGLYPSA